MIGCEKRQQLLQSVLLVAAVATGVFVVTRVSSCYMVIH